MIHANFKIDDDGYIHRDNGAANDSSQTIGAKPDSSTPLTWNNGDDLAINAKAPDFMVNDIFESDSHGILFGDSMTYKTFLALMLAYSICTGHNFFKHQVFSTGKVLYICGEGKSALSRRLLAIRLTFGDFQGNLFVLHDCISIDNGIDMIRLKNAVNEIKPALVIVDTFSSLVSNTDENSNSDVSGVLRSVRDTCSNGSTSSLIIHHKGKDSASGMRGASAFKGNIDFAFEATRNGDSMITTLNCKKMKDGEDFDPINMKAEVVELTGLARQDGKVSTSLVLRSTDEKPKTGKTGDSLDKLDTDILASLSKAIDEKGFSPTQEIIDYFSNNPQNCPKNIVELDDFRPFAYPLLTVAEDSKRTTLKRRIDKLIKLNKCMFYSDYLWTIDQRNTVT
ncbi:MAG: AAA family ATPase [Methylobacter sp.]|nr:AAA family ATPase [Methylobacter sp.]